MVDSENPYASPVASSVEAELVAAPTEVEEIRRKHLNHEASIKSASMVYAFGGFFAGLAASGFGAALRASGAAIRPLDIVFFLFYLGITVLLFILAVGLRRLDGRVRIPVVILSALGLIWFPIGTILNTYILYLMLSSKATMVFSPHYREVIAETPHIKYKTPLVIWILFGLVLLTMASFVLIPVLLD